MPDRFDAERQAWRRDFKEGWIATARMDQRRRRWIVMATNPEGMAFTGELKASLSVEDALDEAEMLAPPEGG